MRRELRAAGRRDGVLPSLSIQPELAVGRHPSRQGCTVNYTLHIVMRDLHCDRQTGRQTLPTRRAATGVTDDGAIPPYIPRAARNSPTSSPVT